VLVRWPHWQLAQLDKRLSLPDPDELRRVATACRQEAEATDASSRRWLHFSKTPRNPKELLLEAADLLESVHKPQLSSAHFLAELAPLASAVDLAIEQLPASWPPKRLLDLVGRVAAVAARLPGVLAVQTGDWSETLAAAGWAVEDKPAAVHVWSEWLSGEGADWFHDLAAFAQTNRQAREWLEAICQAAEVGCFPHIHPQTGTRTWPPNVPVFQPGLTIAVGTPPGAIGSVERFATTPEKARFTLLCGAETTGPLGLAVSAWEQANSPELGPVRQQIAAAIDKMMQTHQGPSAAQVLAVLDELIRVEPNTPQSELAFQSICAWAATGGWSVISEPPVGVDERWTTKAVFKRDAAPGTVLRLKLYGLQGPAGLLRPGEVLISAGPPPHGLTELETAAASIPGAKGDELRTAIRGLRTAGAAGYLELGVVDLYVQFWDRMQPHGEAESPEIQAFLNALQAMLQDSFGLCSFSPTRYRDHPPDWVIVPPGTRMTTGRVTRVLRPGLAKEGVLRLPARIEAE
jgi:hypothetical protein